MAQVFEDEFMNVQTSMLSLCAELAEGKQVDRIYVYGSIENKTAFFNAFYAVGGKTLSASALADNQELVKEFLRVGTHDLLDLASVCDRFGKPTPTEIRLVYDNSTKKLDTKYQYNPVCTEESELTQTQVFLKWKQDEAEALKKAQSMKNAYLSLGSIVILNGGVQKLLVISRALNVRNGDKTFFFDYGAVPYPEGLVSDKMVYFNADQINIVVFEGYRDAEDQAMVDMIGRYLEQNPDIVRGDPKNWA